MHGSDVDSGYLVSAVKVLPHDGGLILQDGELEGVADDTQLLVAQVHPVVPGDIAQDVEWPGGGGVSLLRDDRVPPGRGLTCPGVRW